jgi:exopolysaccharide biosynthesis protein
MNNEFPKECTVFADPRGHTWYEYTGKRNAGEFKGFTHRCSGCGLAASDGKLLYDDKWRNITCSEAVIILIMQS